MVKQVNITPMIKIKIKTPKGDQQKSAIRKTRKQKPPVSAENMSTGSHVLETQLNVSTSIMNDLEMIFRMAYEQGNYTAALKAKELQLKDKFRQGLQTLSLATQLKQLSAHDMHVLIAELTIAKDG